MILRAPALQLACVVLALALGQTASAQTTRTTRVLIEHFEPLHAHKLNTLNIHGSEVTPDRKASVGMFLDLVDDPLAFEGTIGGTAVDGQFVHRQLKATLAASVGLLDWMEISLGLPVVLTQSGDDLAFFGKAGESLGGGAVGDLRLTPKFRILDPERFAGFGLGAAISVWAPTGKTPFNSDDGTRAKPELIVDWRHDSGFKVGLNVGYMMRGRRQIQNFVSDDQITWGLGAEAPLGTKKLMLLASVFGGIQTVDDRDPLDLTMTTDETKSSAAEVDAALRFEPVNDFTITAGGGVGLGDSVRAPDWRVFLGVGYTPTSSDKDDDGIDDRSDQCPEVPEDKDGFADSDGCPDPDNDDDGMLDGDDKCPDEAEDKDGFEDGDGCPDLDNDGDGVPDSADKCPMDAEDADGFEDGDGCPDLDNDGDGVRDAIDKCPNEAEDKDGFEDVDGCPDPDNDGDGILDVDDLCPTQAENKDGVDDEDGCPEVKGQKVKITKGKIIILEKVFFDTGKSSIKKRSHALLTEVAAVLKANPQLTKIRIEGHTDDRGADASNQALSEARAKAVRTFLSERGVAMKRMNARGFGEERPVQPNSTRKGRAANRRVEFIVIEVNGYPVEE